MPDGSNQLTLYLWAALASVAGSLAALSVRPFRNMSRGEIALSLGVSSTFAIFCGPLVASVMFGDGPADVRKLGFVIYGMGAGSHILIPLVIKRLSAFLGSNGNGNGVPK